MVGNDGTEAGAIPEHAQVVLFTLISTPMLRSVDPIQVANFFKELECYKLDVDSKRVEVSTIQLTPYTASVDR